MNATLKSLLDQANAEGATEMAKAIEKVSFDLSCANASADCLKRITKLLDAVLPDWDQVTIGTSRSDQKVNTLAKLFSDYSSYRSALITMAMSDEDNAERFKMCASKAVGMTNNGKHYYIAGTMTKDDLALIPATTKI